MSTFKTLFSKQRILKFIKDILMMTVVFLIMYSTVNYWRQATMPASPVISLTDIQQNRLDIKQLSEQNAILIYFWGTWCHVCQHTTPKIQQLAHDVPVISIAVQSGSEQEIRQYLQQYGYRLTVINDEHGEIFQEWQAKVTPSYLIIKNGQMQQSFVGIQPVWLLKLRMKWANAW